MIELPFRAHKELLEFLKENGELMLQYQVSYRESEETGEMVWVLGMPAEVWDEARNG